GFPVPSPVHLFTSSPLHPRSLFTSSFPKVEAMAPYIGTSGWSYDHWQGVLYPHGAPARARLDYYVARFQTVEVNSSYYHWPRDATFAGWRERVPPGFRMTVKAPRGLTHSARLNAPERWIERIERGLR